MKKKVKKKSKKPSDFRKFLSDFSFNFFFFLLKTEQDLTEKVKLKPFFFYSKQKLKKRTEEEGNKQKN